MVPLLSVIPFALLLNVVSKWCLFTGLLLMCENIKSWHLTERFADTAHLIQPPQIYMSHKLLLQLSIWSKTCTKKYKAHGQQFRKVELRHAFDRLTLPTEADESKHRNKPLVGTIRKVGMKTAFKFSTQNDTSGASR